LQITEIRHGIYKLFCRCYFSASLGSAFCFKICSLTATARLFYKAVVFTKHSPPATRALKFIAPASPNVISRFFFTFTNFFNAISNDTFVKLKKLEPDNTG